MSLTSRDLYRFDDFELQPSRRILVRRGEKLPIAPKTFEVLLCLVANSGRVVLKEDLLKTVWPESFVEESNLTQHIFWLRKALAEKSGYIETIPGRGYEFTGPVQTVTEAEQEQMRSAALPQTSAGFRVQLSSEQTRVVVEETITKVRPRKISRERLVWGILAAAIVLLAAAGWAAWHLTHRVIPGDHHEVVLADFENSTGDPDFDHALKTLLAMDLNQSPVLVVASDRDTKRALKQMKRPADSDLSAAVAREVCERLNDHVVLSGLIARFGQKYLVTLTATECSTGKDLVETKSVAKDREGVITAVDSVAADMRKQLGDPMRALQPTGQKLEQAHTFSLDALKAFTQGGDLHRKAKFAEAVPFYKRALELDPNFTAAWSRLANCYTNLGDGHDAKEANAKAYQLRAFTSEPERLNVSLMYEYWKTGDRHAAIRAAQDWARLYPLQVNPWVLLGNFQSAQGNMDVAIDAVKHAITLDPNLLVPYANLAEYQVTAGRLDDAKATCQKAFSRGFDDADFHHTLLTVAYLQHDDDGFKQQTNWFLTKASDDDREQMEAEVDASQGKLHSAVAHSLRRFDLQEKSASHEAALEGFSGVPLLESDTGLTQDAREHLKKFVPHSPMVGSALAAISIAAAQSGDVAMAEWNLHFLHDKAPQNTDTLETDGPEIQAAIDIAQSKPELAIAAMQPSQPYEVSNPTVLPMRAKAYLAAKQYYLAKRDFHTMIERPYISGIAPDVALAHLGLARAEEMEGNHVEARQEYQTFFDLWKDADPNLPVMQKARLEYAKLK
jgi:DNA-binding winged helix-turn-helix (wHTH) protein/tetratricopeptide (TPR) repeat protein